MSDFPASTRVYTPGTLHQSVRVPFRDISLKDNSSMRVYDTRGPWGDPGGDLRRPHGAVAPCASRGFWIAATPRNTSAGT